MFELTPVSQVMKVRYFSLVVVLLITVLIPFPLIAGATTHSDEQHYTPGILLVKIADMSQEDAAVKVLLELGALEVEPLVRSSGKISPNSPLVRWRKVRFRQDADLKELVEAISENPLFEHLELDLSIRLHSK